MIASILYQQAPVPVDTYYLSVNTEGVLNLFPNEATD